MTKFSVWASKLMFPMVLIPIGAWVIAQGFTARITRNDEWTGAFVHTLEVDVFAVILVASMLINATIATVRRPIAPLTFRHFGKLPLSVLIVLVLSLVWLVALTASPSETSPVEQIAVIGLAACSVVTCTYASKRDKSSILAKQLRQSARFVRMQSVPLTVHDRRHTTGLAIGVPIVTALALFIGVAYTAGEIFPVTHIGCAIDGISQVGTGYIQLDTTGCGSFDIDGGQGRYARYEKLADLETVQIVSLGWTFDLPPRQHLISITREP
jgi:hypothetical protein